MRTNKTQVAGIIILVTTFTIFLALNFYFIELGLFGWFGAIFCGIALGGFLISLIFFFLANSHFKIIATHPKSKIIGWICIAVFIALNIGFNFIGISELARIKNW